MPNLSPVRQIFENLEMSTRLNFELSLFSAHVKKDLTFL